MNEYGALGKTKVLGEKTFPLRLCPRRIPHGLSWERFRASDVGDWKLTARAMAWQKLY